MSDTSKTKKRIIEDYLKSLSLHPERVEIPGRNDHQWLFRVQESSVFLMIFAEDEVNYVWIEMALFQQDSYPYELALFILKTQYSYLHPYRVAISEGGFLVVQYICPIQKVCDEDLQLLLKDLIEFSEYVKEELKQRFILNSISFGGGMDTLVERKK